jgi:hypothetical protein
MSRGCPAVRATSGILIRTLVEGKCSCPGFTVMFAL